MTGDADLESGRGAARWPGLIDPQLPASVIGSDHLADTFGGCRHKPHGVGFQSPPADQRRLPQAAGVGRVKRELAGDGHARLRDATHLIGPAVGKAQVPVPVARADFDGHRPAGVLFVAGDRQLATLGDERLAGVRLDERGVHVARGVLRERLADQQVAEVIVPLPANDFAAQGPGVAARRAGAGG